MVSPPTSPPHSVRSTPGDASRRRRPDQTRTALCRSTGLPPVHRRRERSLRRPPRGHHRHRRDERQPLPGAPHVPTVHVLPAVASPFVPGTAPLHCDFSVGSTHPLSSDRRDVSSRSRPWWQRRAGLANREGVVPDLACHGVEPSPRTPGDLLSKWLWISGLTGQTPDGLALEGPAGSRGLGPIGPRSQRRRAGPAQIAHGANVAVLAPSSLDRLKFDRSAAGDRTEPETRGL